ncbi:MAG TPA: hypothetical protein DCG32_00155 [Sphaerochaeta sp.]|jgi:hypothetical protein|nr:hypothetical protein [Sphaerochaeta sp.]
MSTHPKQIALEGIMRKMCDELDHRLEERFGSAYPRHPNRPARGKAASVAYDGLFSTGTQFTLGYGSDHGRGYIVSVEMRTLSKVKKEDERAVEDATVAIINELLPQYFPAREITLEKDGNVYKLVGDFSLGSSSNE